MKLLEKKFTAKKHVQLFQCRPGGVVCRGWLKDLFGIPERTTEILLSVHDRKAKKRISAELVYEGILFRMIHVGGSDIYTHCSLSSVLEELKAHKGKTLWIECKVLKVAKK